MKLVIENKTDADNNIRSIYTTKIQKGMAKSQIAKKFEDSLPSLKVGWGGSHVWIADNENKRLAIIYTDK